MSALLWVTFLFEDAICLSIRICDKVVSQSPVSRALHCWYLRSTFEPPDIDATAASLPIYSQKIAEFDATC